MKKLFYFLNFTWGIIMNIIGAVGAGVMLALGKKPIRHAGSIVFRTGHYWGGVSPSASSHSLARNLDSILLIMNLGIRCKMHYMAHYF